MKKKLFVLAKSRVGDIVIGIAFGKFSKIIPVKKLKDTKYLVAFWHPKPFWEKHILVVPKKPIKNLQSLKREDYKYIKEIIKISGELVTELDWEKDGYSLLVNGGARQEVNQLHFHLNSGKIL